MSKVTVDTKELDTFRAYISNFPVKASDKTREAVKTSTFNVQRYAKENLTKNGNIDTGRLRNSITTKIGYLEGTVSTNVKYARIIEEGSKPHIIRPKSKKFLYWKGASHPVKQVKHPGTKPSPYMSNALEKEIPNFIKLLEKAVELE